MALNDKQKLFADTYLILGNATLAYKEAYKVKNDNVAAVNAQRLLRNAKVNEYVTTRQEKIANKLQITQEMVVDGYRKLAFFDMRRFYDKNGSLIPVPDLDEETAFALVGIDVTEEWDTDEKGKRTMVGYTKKLKTSSRKEALDGICRVLGFNAPEKFKDVTDYDVIVPGE